MNLPANSDVMQDANHHVTQEQIDRNRWKPITAASIIFAKVGAAIMLERKRKAAGFLIDNNMMAFTPSSDLDYDFCIQLLRNTEFSRYAQTGALPSYNAGDLSGIDLIIPSLPEQRRIADALSAVDAKIDLLGRKRDAITRFKVGLMQKLFSQEVRFTRNDGTAYSDWEEKELGDVLAYQQPTPYLVESSDYRAGAATPVLTAGKTFILGYTDEEWGIYNALPVIIFDDFTTDSRYVDFTFKAKSSAMKMLTVRYARDSCRVIYEAMKQIDYEPSGHKRHWISEYQHLTVMLPSPEEQAQLEQAVIDLDGRLDAMTRQITTMQAFKKGLLQQMFV